MFPKLLLTLLNDNTVEDIATIFYNQLKIDYEIVTKEAATGLEKSDFNGNIDFNGKPVLKVDMTSDYCFHAPKICVNNELKSKLSHKLCLKFFPLEPFTKDADISAEEKEKIMRKHSYIRYDRYVAKIKQYKKKIESDNKNINKLYLEMKKTVYNEGKFCLIRNRKELSNNIMNPTPMPVDIPPIEELNPFFDFLKKSEQVSSDNANGFVEFKRGIFYNDGRMDLCKQVVADVHINKLMDSLVDNKYIEHFLLGNNIMNTEGCNAISRFIVESVMKCKEQIKTWYLAGNRIDSEGIKMICNALIQSKTTKSLWLKRNPIGPVGAASIASLLRYNKSIEVLDLTNTGIMDDGAKYIFEALCFNTTLKYLYVGACGLEDIDYIIDYFKYIIDNDIHGLEYIYLEMNRIGNYYSKKLVSVIKDYKHMKGFVLSSNRITDCTFLDSLVDNETIVYLDLGFYKSTLDLGELPNNFSIENKEANINSIINFITHNKTVKIFSFLNTGLSEEAVEKISHSVLYNDSILLYYYEQYNTPLNRDIINRFRMTREMKRKYHITNDDIREIKHGSLIRFIDSNYRNNM